MTPDIPRAAVPSAILDDVRAANPDGVEVVPIDAELDLDTVDFIVPGGEDGTWKLVCAVLPQLERVQVVQVLSAGTEWIEPLMPPQATLANARGARDAPVAEWIVAALLGTTSRLLEWAPRTRWESGLDVTDLSSWTVLVVGMGSIGHTLKRMLAPFGPRVVGVASRARDDLHGIDELPQLLPHADALVILTPLTDATRGLIGAEELALLPDGALVINAARGAVLDSDALLAETSVRDAAGTADSAGPAGPAGAADARDSTGPAGARDSGDAADPPSAANLTGSGPRLRAVLDVTDPEPLPDGHPLWTAPGVLAITPHLSGGSRLADAQATALAARQLARWLAGEPLENVVPLSS